MSEIRFDRMDATFKFINARRANHNQRRWMEGDAIDMNGTELLDSSDNVCNTAGCFAGWGSLISGYFQLRSGGAYTSTGKWVDFGDEKVVDETGSVYYMNDAAREAFGLSEDQAHCLFNSWNTVEEIEQMIDYLREYPDGIPSHIGGPARLLKDDMTIRDY